MIVGLAIGLALGIQAYIVKPYQIPSQSMEHTLNENDRVLVNKLVYDFRDPHRGEVIVFTSPVDWRGKVKLSSTR